MSLPTLTDALARMPCFARLAPASLAALARGAHRHTLNAEEMIFVQGQPSAGLWVIESGSVKVARFNIQGSEYVMHLLGPGDTFNEIAAFDGGPNPATATALSLSTCWNIPSESLRSQFDHDPQLARAVAETFAARVRVLIGQIEELALYSVTARLARFLLKQAGTPALNEPGITRAAIAGHLATTPETVSRLLGKLQDAGAIRFDRHRIYIANADLLRTIAGEGAD